MENSTSNNQHPLSGRRGFKSVCVLTRSCVKYSSETRIRFRRVKRSLAQYPRVFCIKFKGRFSQLLKLGAIRNGVSSYLPCWLNCKKRCWHWFLLTSFQEIRRKGKAHLCSTKGRLFPHSLQYHTMQFNK